jgi:hypothetical protein
MRLKKDLENLQSTQMANRRVRQLVPPCLVVQGSDGNSSSSSNSNKTENKKRRPYHHSRQNTDSSCRSCNLPTANNHRFQIFLH